MALTLYGEPDPERIVAAGLHGLGGRPTRIGLTQDGPCRFTLTTDNQSETIDFEQISARFAEMADPAAGLAGMAGRPRGGPGRHLTTVVLAGAETASCSAALCSPRRVFALSHPERLEEARAASHALSNTFCRPRGAG